MLSYLRFGDHQQLGHFGALAGAEILFVLEHLLQLEDLPAGERGACLLLSPRIR